MLENDETVLDYDCGYWVPDGAIAQFSGPLPDDDGFDQFVSVKVLSNKEAMFGPFRVEVGQRLGLRILEKDLTVPIGLVEDIQLNRVHFIPVVPSRGKNYCPASGELQEGA